MNQPNRYELLERWIESHDDVRIKDERGRLATLQLHKAMIAWLSGESSVPNDALLLAPLRSKRSQVRYYAGNALSTIVLLEPTECETVLRIFRKVSIVACQAILYSMTPPIDTKVISAVLRVGAQHRSPVVRKLAVSYAYFNDIADLHDFLANAARTEKDEFVLQRIRQYQDIARQGYHATFDAHSWSWDVAYISMDPVAPPRGICSANVPKGVIDAIGFDRALEHLRAAFARGDVIVPWDEIVEDL